MFNKNIKYNCLKGQENDCCKRLKFFVDKKYFDIEVIYWGNNRKGEINTETLAVKNFVDKVKIELKELKNKN